MKLGVLFSGGKDSVCALAKAMEKEEVVCLISIISHNPESYMFHTPNIELTSLQARAIGLPLIQHSTKGEKEKELGDLKHAIEKARDEFAIEGIVTGAIESVYQATRVQRMCHELGLWCYNPLWKKDQVELLNELVETGFHAIVSGIFAYPLTEHWLGKNIDKDMIKELIKLNRKYQISPSGEGGELETTVLDAPLFRKRIVLDEWNIKAKEHAGVLSITRAHLGNK